MPELPEVETIRRGLLPSIQGKTIAKATLRLPRILLGSKKAAFQKILQGQRFEAITRRGKYLIMHLNEGCFIIHLGMTGQLMYSPEVKRKQVKYNQSVAGLPLFQGDTGIDKHTHFIIELEEGSCLLFRDIRTFGKIVFVKDGDWENHPRIKLLGPEPLDLKIKSFLKNKYPITSRKNIKALLLEQKFISGVGNIYADEALYDAKIHPESICADLISEHWESLLKSVKKVLRRGIKNNGTSFSDYRNADGSKGSNQENLLVYGRGGEPCKTCKSKLIKIVVAQRGTVYCEKCQKLA